MRVQQLLVAASLLTFTAPAAAAADGLIIPFFGVNFGGESGNDFSEAFDASRYNWGASFAFMGSGVVGVEGDVGYSPDFYGKTDRGGSSNLAVSGNLLLGVPFGGQSGFGIRPYGLVGVGVIQSRAEVFDETIDDDQMSWNVGGGVMFFFGAHLGARADICYFRTFDELDLAGADLGSNGPVDFTRATGGLILRF